MNEMRNKGDNMGRAHGPDTWVGPVVWILGWTRELDT